MRQRLEKRSRYAGTAQHVKLQGLLVPVDFTPATLQSLRFAGTLAEQFGSTIYLLHVIEDHPMAMSEAAVMVAKLDAELGQEATEQLSRLAREELAMSVSVKQLVRRGNVAREILHAAETLDADLIILATPRHSRLGRLLWGRTARCVERYAPCPVLVIRCEDSSPTETFLWRDAETGAGRLHPQPAM